MIEVAEIRAALAERLRPPPMTPVSQTIERVLVTNDGPYSLAVAPYMREPADMLTSRQYRTVCFIGPARCSKTVTLVDGWIARMIVDNPGDMLVVQSSQDLARDYSKYRVERFVKANDEILARMSRKPRDNGTFDIRLRSGARVAFGWPSGGQLAGRDFQFVAITEYDNAEEDIDKQGSLLRLAATRAKTYGSAGKVMLESSPRRVYLDPTWTRKLPHQAPPAKGITAIYNTGTMCWLYWPCKCGHWIPLDPDVHVMFRLPELSELVKTVTSENAAEWAADVARLRCPMCDREVQESSKRELNARAIWVPSGCRIEESRVVGAPQRTGVASYWLSSVAAAYQTWAESLLEYAQGIAEYGLTGSDSQLRTTVNVTQGRPYLPIRSKQQRSGHELQARGETWPAQTVPHGVRVLLAAVDVQAGADARFEVQVVGYGVGLERWVVDRFPIRSSRRPDPANPGKWLRVDPATYVEDWDRLIDRVINRRYALADGSGRTMPVRCVACDSGGAKSFRTTGGVTSRAYDFWRSLIGKGLHRKFQLVKGVDSQSVAVKLSYPDSSRRKDRDSGAASDVPVLLIDSTKMKDDVMARVWRAEPGPGFIHFPDWLPTSFYDELTAEVRGEKRWENNGKANEAVDLFAYADGLALYMDLPKIDWSAPPAWARPWEQNPDIAAPVATQPRRALRRVASSYVQD